MTKKLTGLLFGDKGYIKKELFQELFDRGLKLVTSIKKGMKNALMPLNEKILLRKRSIIETVFGYLKNKFEIEHTRHRSPSFKFSTFRVHYEQALSNDLYRLNVTIFGEIEPHTKNYNGIYERSHQWNNLKALYPLPQSLLPAIKFAKAQVVLSNSWKLGEINAYFPVTSIEEEGSKFLLGGSKLSEQHWNFKYKPILERFSVTYHYQAKNFTDQKVIESNLTEHYISYKNSLDPKQDDPIHKLENYILVFYPGALTIRVKLRDCEQI